MTLLTKGLLLLPRATRPGIYALSFHSQNRISTAALHSRLQCILLHLMLYIYLRKAVPENHAGHSRDAGKRFSDSVPAFFTGDPVDVKNLIEIGRASCRERV